MQARTSPAAESSLSFITPTGKLLAPHLMQDQPPCCIGWLIFLPFTHLLFDIENSILTDCLMAKKIC